MATKNRLARSRSPYLRQHEDNPVDWYPWGEEALERARVEDRPILLSVGYSACHWCHVMAHESFEDPETAALMNEHFINIKVDREERPDIDAIYQKVVQLMGQGGGWPLTVFLTPDQKPFYGGTYFPVQPSHGRPAFRQVLAALHKLYTSDRPAVAAQTERFSEGYAVLEREFAGFGGAESGGVRADSPAALGEAVARVLRHVDKTWGGIGGAPKFPSPTTLELLLRMARRAPEGSSHAALCGPSGEAAAALRLTLEKMWRGGVYDHLRGGFARYSVDRFWRVPHFEKMLYDNAQLLGLYAEAAALWPEDAWLRRVAADTVAYLEEDMRDPCGGFYAATDADSEGVEGKYFAWTPAQIREALGDPELAARVIAIYGVTDDGTFEHGLSVLQRQRPLAALAKDMNVETGVLEDALARGRAALLQRRYARVPPLRDEKILTSWNGLLISGLCRAAGAAEAPSWGDAALRARCLRLAAGVAEYLLEHHVADGGRVLRVAFADQAHTRGYARDLGTLARALLDLHEHDLDPRWVTAAAELATHALRHHARHGGGFYMTADDAEVLIERTEAQFDTAVPGATGPLLDVLARLDALGVAVPGGRAQQGATLDRFAGAATQPMGCASVLAAAHGVSPEAVSVVLYGDAHALAGVVRAVRVALRPPIRVGRGRARGRESAPGPAPCAVVCRGQVCSAPITDPGALARELRRGIP